MLLDHDLRWKGGQDWVLCHNYDTFLRARMLLDYVSLLQLSIYGAFYNLWGLRNHYFGFVRKGTYVNATTYNVTSSYELICDP